MCIYQKNSITTSTMHQTTNTSSIASYTVMLSFMLLLKPLMTSSQNTLSSEHYGEFGDCSARPGMQEAAHTASQLYRCEPRDQLVILDLPNSTYFHMVPDRVMVRRCGGTCSARIFTSCLPSQRNYRNVDVILTAQHSRGGVAPQECSTVSVEEHHSCTCGCRTTAADCSEIQSFVPRECKCVCADAEAKRTCQRQGNNWDETTCSCLCLPREQWTTCHSGYAFNPSIDTCACVSISEYASSVLAIVIIVLVSSMAMISFGLVQCYRTRTGLFRDEAEPARGINETSALTLTTSIRRHESGDDSNNHRERNRSGSPKFMTLNELRSLFRMLSGTSRTSTPSSPTSSHPPLSPNRGFLSPHINYIPISEAGSRSQSSTSVTTTADDLSNAAEMSNMSSTASPNGPSRIATICEALDELDYEEDVTLNDEMNDLH